jgi:hypothetical protein
VTETPPRLFRCLPDGTYRPIERVPGGPPTPTATVQDGETLIIDTPGGQIEVTILGENEAMVRVLATHTHRV